MRRLSMVVDGRPYPQGSKRHVGGGRMVESSGENVKRYRQRLNDEARAELHRRGILEPVPASSAVAVSILFAFPRPLSHFGTGRNADVLKETAPRRVKTTRGDLDKLTRAVGDALTSAQWYVDDEQVEEGHQRITWVAPDDRRAYPEGFTLVTMRELG